MKKLWSIPFTGYARINKSIMELINYFIFLSRYYESNSNMLDKAVILYHKVFSYLKFL